MPWKDDDARKEYMKKYAQKPDQIEKRKVWAKANRNKMHGYQQAWHNKDPQNGMIVKSRSNAKARGLEFTIIKEDLHWPTHCPVLGMELDYTTQRGAHRDNWPSLDRWDNSKGYVPGNVFVISWRANRIKFDCTEDEIVSLLSYMRSGGLVGRPVPM